MLHQPVIAARSQWPATLGRARIPVQDPAGTITLTEGQRPYRRCCALEGADCAVLGGGSVLGPEGRCSVDGPAGLGWAALTGRPDHVDACRTSSP